MGWIISVVFGVLIGTIVWAIGRRLRWSKDPQARRVGGWLALVAPLLMCVWVIISTLVAMVHQVPAGHVGVVYQFGAVRSQTTDGLQIIPPWRTLRVASVQVQKRRFERIEAFSRETQDVYVWVALNYQVSPTGIQALYRNVGPDYFERLVPQRVNNLLKEETVRYATTDVAPNREPIRVAVRARLQQDLAPYSITVNDFLIENIDFSDPFKRSIEAKQIATQNALEELAKIEAERNRAQQQVEKARGEAEAIRLRGTALRDNPDVLKLNFVEKLTNVQWGFLPSEGVVPFLPLPAPTPRP